MKLYVEDVKVLKYLRSTVTERGEMKVEVRNWLSKRKGKSGSV